LEYEIQEGPYGPKLILKSEWSESVRRYIVENQITGLYLGSAIGWSDHQVGFLESVPELLSLGILDWKIKDLTPVAGLTKLRELSLRTDARTRLDFTRFPELESLQIEWINGYESLFDVAGLRQLSINRLPTAKAPLLANLTRLTKLRVMSCGAKSLDCLRGLTNLRMLWIALFRNLEDNDFLTDLHGLKVLFVDSSSGFRSLEPLRQLKNLEILGLDNVRFVESLKPIEAHDMLEGVWLGDSTNILDGRVSILKSLPNLKMASVANRRHYDVKPSDLPSEPVKTWDRLV
jgi:internalin A